MKRVSADFPPLFGPQVPLKICFGSIWTAFQEVSLNPSTDTFRFKGIYVLQDLKANYDSSAGGTRRTLLSGKSSFLQHICFLGSFCVPPLLQNSCLCIYGKNCASPCERAHVHYLSTEKLLPSSRHLPAVRGLLFPARLASRLSIPRGQA